MLPKSPLKIYKNYVKHFRNVKRLVKGEIDIKESLLETIKIETLPERNIFDKVDNSLDKVSSTLKLESNEKLVAGDIIGVKRPYPNVIHHFGVYVGSGKVVHFTDSNHSKRNADIYKTSLKSFLTYKKADSYIVQNDFYKMNIKSIAIDRGLKELSLTQTYVRAESMIHKQRGDYNLLFNNCETFAIWCKFNEKMLVYQGLNFNQRYYLKFGKLNL